MTPPVVARLKAAGLLDVAERAAKRVELRLADCITPAEVTGGHRALWKALAKEGKTAAQIATIVDFPERIVAAEVSIPEARPTPTPKSGPRVKSAPAQDDVTPLRAEVAALRAEVAELRAMLRPTSSQTTDFDPEKWLDAHGETGRRLRQIVDTYGVALDVFFSATRSAHATTARRAAVVYLTEQGFSQPEIGRILRREHTTICYAQRRAGVRAAHSTTRKAAA